jgi:predicted RNase H-like HicB family nuclease
MRYRVELYHSDEGYAVSCPSLPGCWSQGETREEAVENIGIAIQEYLSVQSSRPSPRSEAVAEETGDSGTAEVEEIEVREIEVAV